MQQMCPAAACLPCLPCWPLIHFACACWCPDLPDLLGHVDFLMLSQRVFPHNLWQFTLWAVNDYKSLLSILPPCSREGGKGCEPQLSQCGQEHNFELTSISVYLRRQLWAAVPEKRSWCLFSCPYYKSASGQGTWIALRSPWGNCDVCMKGRAGLQHSLGADLKSLLYVRGF